MAFDQNLIDLGTILAKNPPLQAQINAILNNRMALGDLPTLYAIHNVLRANGIPSYIANVGAPVGINLNVGTIPALVGLADPSAFGGAYRPLWSEIQAQSTIQALVSSDSQAQGFPSNTTGSGNKGLLIGAAIVAVVVLLVVAA